MDKSSFKRCMFMMLFRSRHEGISGCMENQTLFKEVLWYVNQALPFYALNYVKRNIWKAHEEDANAISSINIETGISCNDIHSYTSGIWGQQR
jgi:hypothetical protein